MLNGKYVLENTTRWYKDGALHREDGPAVIRANGSIAWWHNGKYYISIHEFAKVAGWTDKQLAEYLLRN